MLSRFHRAHGSRFVDDDVGAVRMLGQVVLVIGLFESGRSRYAAGDDQHYGARTEVSACRFPDRRDALPSGEATG